jgi:hypothetical protein
MLGRYGRLGLLMVAIMMPIASCGDPTRAASNDSTGRQGRFSVHEAASGVAKVTVVLAPYVQTGAQLVATTTAADAGGILVQLPGTHTITWSSSNTVVASIKAGSSKDQELVSALTAGSANICATVDGVKGCSTLTVSSVGALTGSAAGPASIPVAKVYTFSADGHGGWQEFTFVWWICPNGQRAIDSGNHCTKVKTDDVVGNISSFDMLVRNADGLFSLWIHVMVPGQAIWVSTSVDASHALDASISAPTLFNTTGQTCTWYSRPVGGVPPYTYAWQLDGGNYYTIGSTTASNYVARLYGASSHTAYLTVQDAAGYSYFTSAYSPNLGYGSPGGQCTS